jgi:hypothetical protein
MTLRRPAQWLGGATLAVALLTACASTTSGGGTGTSSSSVTAVPRPSAAAVTTHSAPATHAAVSPTRLVTNTQVDTIAPPPPATTSAAPACHPLTNGGNCYRAGELCRNSDHGVSGVAGNGTAIKCEDNNGWRWEPV